MKKHPLERCIYCGNVHRWHGRHKWDSNSPITKAEAQFAKLSGGEVSFGDEREVLAYLHAQVLPNDSRFAVPKPKEPDEGGNVQA